MAWMNAEEIHHAGPQSPAAGYPEGIAGHWQADGPRFPQQFRFPGCGAFVFFELPP